MSTALSSDGINIPAVAVFGSTYSSHRVEGDIFDDVSARVGKALALNGVMTLTGGGSRGVMGIVADQAEHHGGQVLGITIGDAFKPSDEHQEIIMLECADYFDRLREYWLKADAFIAAPGGIGTIAELLNVAAMARCGIEVKPLLILNINGYYDPIYSLFEKARTHGWLGDAYDKFTWMETIQTGDALDEVLNTWLVDNGLSTKQGEVK